MIKTIVLAAMAVAAVEGTVLFKETFDDSYTERWIESTAKGADQGKFILSAGKHHHDPEADKGVKTSEDGKFYGISSKIDTPFSNKGKDLVVQFQAKHEQNIDCGGGYIKLYPSGLEQTQLDGETPYNIMFGPDICGSTKRVHVIFTYNGENHLKKVDVPAKSDEFAHLYTLVVHPDNTYEVLIDHESAAKGDIEEDWDILEPKEIDDKDAVKPEDWDERVKIPDESDVKPANYDDITEFIVDETAEKPEDWDEDEDGEWEAPMIDNPEFRGPWVQKTIDNPDYKGKWVRPKVANPDYKKDENLHAFEDNAFIGFDLWQVKSGTIFDNIIVTDDLAEAEEFAKETFDLLRVGEKKMIDEAMAELKAKNEASGDAEGAEDEEVIEADVDVDEEEEL
ncbi:calreticulin [Sphaeroforma arctica JP610]|uniref:Calreticulin n=1 Tax=Sphaeroforma arctica JP610 TaxID=667725 RepID=A0A0L0G0J5_9EUKA|nr:calreticulin [Sphaeroforma arctica JP610]KNC81733.1 calreticulin [Sphaeroforma arctica JP610]|eukprot:XP_014155635.1 calreticulin [Sphaeroforma arctica JP610]